VSAPVDFTRNGDGTPCWEYFHNEKPRCSLCDTTIEPNGEPWVNCDGWAEHLGCHDADSEASAASDPAEDPHR
jgi:hypothetical protein